MIYGYDKLFFFIPRLAAIKDLCYAFNTFSTMTMTWTHWLLLILLAFIIFLSLTVTPIISIKLVMCVFVRFYFDFLIFIQGQIHSPLPSSGKLFMFLRAYF